MRCSFSSCYCIIRHPDSSVDEVIPTMRIVPLFETSMCESVAVQVKSEQFMLSLVYQNAQQVAQDLYEFLYTFASSAQ